jgi:hypothetical protein
LNLPISSAICSSLFGSQKRKRKDVDEEYYNNYRNHYVHLIHRKSFQQYVKERMMIGLAHFFPPVYTGSDHTFFSCLIHTKAVDVEDYDPVTE